jgi:hypothetical protein
MKRRTVLYATICSAFVLGLSLATAQSHGRVFSHGPVPPPDGDGNIVAHGPVPPPDGDGNIVAHGPVPPPDGDGNIA